MAAITGLLIGATPEAVGVGLWSYNGVLNAMAIGGTFYAPTRLSVAVGLLGAAAASLITPGLSALLAQALAPGFPLQLPFIVATLAMMMVIRWSLHSLLPVALHAIYTPEEHRRRYEVSRSLLGDFRHRLRAVVGGRHPFVPSAIAFGSGDAREREAASELRQLYRQLDRNGNGRLSVTELATGLMQRRRGGQADLVNRSLMLRLWRLSEGEERLMHYLMPVDVNGDHQLDPTELRRLFGSVGQPPLTPQEERHLFGPLAGRLSWSAFIDRLLLV